MLDGLELSDFKAMLNVGSDGAFKTSVEKTKGQLYVDGNGNLANANRHWKSVTLGDSLSNYEMRRQLVDAFAKDGASKSFVDDLRVELGLNGNSEVSFKPLERRSLKQWILNYEKCAESQDEELRSCIRTLVDVKNAALMKETNGFVLSLDRSKLGRPDGLRVVDGATDSDEFKMRQETVAAVLRALTYQKGRPDDATNRCVRRILGCEQKPPPPLTLGRLRMADFVVRNRAAYNALIGFSTKPEGVEKHQEVMEALVRVGAVNPEDKNFQKACRCAMESVEVEKAALKTAVNHNRKRLYGEMNECLSGLIRKIGRLCPDSWNAKEQKDFSARAFEQMWSNIDQIALNPRNAIATVLKDLGALKQHEIDIVQEKSEELSVLNVSYERESLDQEESEELSVLNVSYERESLDSKADLEARGVNADVAKGIYDLFSVLNLLYGEMKNSIVKQIKNRTEEQIKSLIDRYIKNLVDVHIKNLFDVHIKNLTAGPIEDLTMSADEDTFDKFVENLLVSVQRRNGDA